MLRPCAVPVPGTALSGPRHSTTEGLSLPKRNYSFEKRKKELAKKRKKAEKLERKRERSQGGSSDDSDGEDLETAVGE